MSIFSDIQTIFELLKPRASNLEDRDRLSARYKLQARNYDSFRERLLAGRVEILEKLIPDGFTGTWVDLGGGTGWNINQVSQKVKDANVFLVDMCAPLLEVAKQTLPKSVNIVNYDATKFSLPEPADLVTFSYSLTMIPEWFKAVDNAFKLLRSGGKIGVVDFFVSRKHPSKLEIRHNWLERTFWPVWFSHDDVFLNGDILNYLAYKFEPLESSCYKNSIPYLPFFKVPYYEFIGIKK